MRSAEPSGHAPATAARTASRQADRNLSDAKTRRLPLSQRADKHPGGHVPIARYPAVVPVNTRPGR